MTKEIIKTSVYSSIYGRLKCIAETIGISEEIIVNNWLMKGMSTDWKFFTDYFEELEKRNIQGDKLKKKLNLFFASLAAYYDETNVLLEEQDYQEEFLDNMFEFRTIAEDVEFRKQYFGDRNKRKTHL